MSYGLDILRECSPPSMFYMCPISHVVCHVSHVKNKIKVVKLVSEGSVINKAYPV